MIDQVLIVVGITFLVMVSPGPDMVLVLRNTLVGGRIGGLQTSLGVLTGNLVHISYCVLGIGWVISRSIIAFSFLKIAAAVYLIYLGIMSFRSSGTTLDASAATIKRRNRTWFLQGFVNNILNPKGTLFYLGVFTVVITPGTTVSSTIVLIVIMMAVSALFWLVFVYTLAHPAVRRLIDQSQRIVHRIFGALLILLGLRVATMEAR